MAGKENIRKEFSPDDRNLELDVSPDTKAKADIWMTSELKQAAKVLQNSWNISHEDQMAALSIRDANLKFADQSKRALFYEGLVKLAKLVNPNFPSTYPLHKPTMPESSNTADEVWLNFWYKYFLPDGFDTVMQDVAGTELKTIPAQPEILAQAKSYLAAYGPGFVRMDLVAGEGADQGVVDSLTHLLREAQIRFMQFMQPLVKCMSDPEVYRVVIHGENQFEVDGVQKEFTGAALRALLALALLRNKLDFKLEDFARLYHGGNVIDARTDFDNAMRPLKKELPNISIQTPEQNHRCISGIKFWVGVSDDVIRKRLTSLHKI